MEHNILICGVGGQGTLLASKILGEYALLKGMDCKLSEVHGMSQRGGSVVTYVRMGEKINSPLLEKGEADIILAFEELESLRFLSVLKKGGKVVYSLQQIMPMTVVSGAASYPQNINATLSAHWDSIPIDAYSLSKGLGNEKTANTIMLGALAKAISLDKETMLKAIASSVKEKFIEINKQAFEIGFSN